MFNTFFPKNHTQKYGRARKATDDNILCHRKYVICTPNNKGHNTDRHS